MRAHAGTVDVVDERELQLVDVVVVPDDEMTEVAIDTQEGSDRGSPVLQSASPAPKPPPSRASSVLSLSRQHSYMQDVRDRIGMLQDAKSPYARSEFADRASRNRSQLHSETMSRKRKGASTAYANRAVEEGTEKSCRISFYGAVVGSITASCLLACVGMFILVEVFMLKFSSDELRSCQNRTLERRKLIDFLSYDTITKQQYETRLRAVVSTIDEFVIAPADRAVDAVWGSMAAQHHTNPAWVGKSDAEREEVAYHSWVELTRLWRVSSDCESNGIPGNTTCIPRLVALFAAFLDGYYSGCSVTCSRTQSSEPCSTPRTALWDGAPEPSRGSNSSSLLAAWQADVRTGGRGEQLQSSRWEPRGIAPFVVQEQLAEAANASVTRNVARAWSKVHMLSDAGDHGITWTAPIAYCRHYRCFDGVVGASTSLRDVSLYCRRLWVGVRDSLANQTPSVVLDEDMSGIFIVNQFSEFSPDQQGLLMASSGLEASTSSEFPRKATSSSHAIVRDAARALSSRLRGSGISAWGQPGESLDEVGVVGNELFSQRSGLDTSASTLFNFSRKSLERYFEGDVESWKFANCNVSKDERVHSDTDCIQVGAVSMSIDKHTSWLVVVVLPAGTFGAQAVETRKDVDANLKELADRFHQVAMLSRGVGAVVVLIVVVASLVLASLLGALVSKPLHRLSALMWKLHDLDFAHESAEFAELQPGRQSRIQDVRELQEAFRKLSRGTEAFSRFVPETVVRNIIHGDTSATKLQVSRRIITIMNSDIEGFTGMSEHLTQRDLLFVLTRYLSVMTRVVEMYDGVVSEIQGDGLIVFWNTPDDVEDHAAKACAASLAQQQAVVLLNAEFATLDLQHLNVRIGIHTGYVMSGNIGSESKMKFGCLGEPMKVAEFLQSDCKTWGVQVMCSADTYQEVDDGSAFFRELGTVQVKSNGEATVIYEVYGCENPPEEEEEEKEEMEQETVVESEEMEKEPGLQSSLKSSRLVATEAMRKSASSLQNPGAPIWWPISR